MVSSQEALRWASDHLGYPYVWGAGHGNNPRDSEAWDCSSFVCAAFDIPAGTTYDLVYGNHLQNHGFTRVDAKDGNTGQPNISLPGGTIFVYRNLPANTAGHAVLLTDQGDGSTYEAMGKAYGCVHSLASAGGGIFRKNYQFAFLPPDGGAYWLKIYRWYEGATIADVNNHPGYGAVTLLGQHVSNQWETATTDSNPNDTGLTAQQIAAINQWATANGGTIDNMTNTEYSQMGESFNQPTVPPVTP